MKILLININPVVSRLLTLCTRDEHIGLEEAESAEAVEEVSYDILFVDEASYVGDVRALIEGLEVRKKVFITHNEDAAKGFDETIKKPFLPSQIIQVIESVGMPEALQDVAEENPVKKRISIFPLSAEEESVTEEVLPAIFPLSAEDEEAGDVPEMQEGLGTEILNGEEIEKIKALLSMEDDEIEMNVALLNDDEYEAHKVKVIKEQLIADGLELVEENEIVDELSAVAEETFGKRKRSKEAKETLFSQDELSRIEEAVAAAVGKMKPKKIKKLLKGKEIEIKIKLEGDQ